MKKFALLGAVAAFALSYSAKAAVIGDDLYFPLNLTGVISYVDDNGKMQTAKFTSKDVLNYEDYDKGTQLAVGTDGHVYAINKTEVLDDLTGEGYFSINENNLLYTESSSKTSGAGTTEIAFYSDANTNLDENDYSFDVTGNYTFSESYSSPDTDGYFHASIKSDSKNLGGLGYDYDVSGDELPVSGSATGSASGKLQE